MYRHGDSGQAVGCTDMETERQIYTDRQIKMLTDKLASSHAQTNRQTDRQTYTKGPKDIHITGHYDSQTVGPIFHAFILANGIKD